MKVVGIIAEYNPFHNGHAYQIQQAKELSHADYVIVAMSGNYVQRGVPAIIDKFSRASMALQNGADFVFELPVLWSTASAEYFASAGIALFHRLGCVDTISFGCETPDLSVLTHVAKLLVEEPQAYEKLLSSYLKEGLSFPVARAKAVLAFSSEVSTAKLDKLLGAPNNILALEYMKALIRSNSSITPLPILRQGAGYHTMDFNNKFCSATAIRSLLLDAPSNREQLLNFIPRETAAYLLKNDAYYLSEQDFSQMLYYKLLSEKNHGFSRYADSSAELSNKISNAILDFTDYRNFCQQLKSKDLTYTRISRLLLHILLNITNENYETGTALGYVPYLRLLGFRKEASLVFQKIKETSLVPLLFKPSKDALLLDKSAYSMYEQDVFVSNLYYGTYANKSGQKQKNEYQRELVIVT